MVPKARWPPGAGLFRAPSSSPGHYRRRNTATAADLSFDVGLGRGRLSRAGSPARYGAGFPHLSIRRRGRLSRAGSPVTREVSPAGAPMPMGSIFSEYALRMLPVGRGAGPGRRVWGGEWLRSHSSTGGSRLPGRATARGGGGRAVPGAHAGAAVSGARAAVSGAGGARGGGGERCGRGRGRRRSRAQLSSGLPGSPRLGLPFAQEPYNSSAENRRRSWKMPARLPGCWLR